MIPLETEFYSRGFCHKLVRRAGFVCVCARFRRPRPENVHYEVVIIREGKAHTIAGKDFPAKEYYPSSEEWGRYGWTYRDEDQARAKFGALVRTSDSMHGTNADTSIGVLLDAADDGTKT